MEKQPLSTLLSELEQELLRLGYMEGSMKFYRNRWSKIMDFAQKRGELHFTEKLGIDFRFNPLILEPVSQNRLIS